MKQDLQSLTVLTVTFRKHLKPFTINIHFQIILIYSNTCYFIHLLYLLPSQDLQWDAKCAQCLEPQSEIGFGDR